MTPYCEEKIKAVLGRNVDLIPRRKLRAELSGQIEHEAIAVLNAIMSSISTTYCDEEIVWRVIKEQFPTLKTDIESMKNEVFKNHDSPIK